MTEAASEIASGVIDDPFSFARSVVVGPERVDVRIGRNGESGRESYRERADSKDDERTPPSVTTHSRVFGKSHLAVNSIPSLSPTILHEGTNLQVTMVITMLDTRRP